MDDFTIVGRTAEECHQRLQVVLADMKRLGPRPDPGKGCWSPSRCFRVLGLVIDTERRLVIAPEEKITEIVATLEALLVSPVWTARQLAAIAGKIISIARAFQPARLYTSEFYALVSARRCQQAHDWDSTLVPSADARADVQWLLANLSRRNGHAAWRPSQIMVISVLVGPDSWIATVPGSQPAKGPTPRELKGAEREAHALAEALVALRREVRDRWLTLKICSAQLATWLRKGGPREEPGRTLVRAVFSAMAEVNAAFWSAEQVSLLVMGQEEWTRSVDVHDWELRRHIYDLMVQHFAPRHGVPVVDRMASSTNAKCVMFNSWFHEPRSVAVNCFTQNWAGALNYVCPPFGLVHQVLLHIDSCGARAIVIVPVWRAQPWWPLLLEMLEEELFPLPGGPGAFVAGPSGRVEPHKVGSWHMAAALVGPRAPQQSW